METVQWFTDDEELSQNIIDVLRNDVKNKINLSFLNTLENTLPNIQNNTIVIQCTTPNSEVFSSDIIKDFLEDNNGNQQVVCLIPIGYCTQNSHHALTNFISAITMYDKVTVIAHSLLCCSLNDIQGINPDESIETNCLQPVTFSDISDILSIVFEKDFNHILVYAVGKTTFSSADDEKNTFFSRLTTQNKKLTHRPYITKKRIDTGITDLLLQMSSEYKKQSILVPTVIE